MFWVSRFVDLLCNLLTYVSVDRPVCLPSALARDPLFFLCQIQPRVSAFTL